MLNGFVGAIGEDEVVGLDAEEFRKLLFDLAVFGINSQPRFA
jgi:hypothetical protein